ncbi:MAG: SDR family NAD(P)-dependent oxidoreductase [Rhodospirillaceae bacterium]|nr:SDR family NAD(P)-dependent oxidoreductase [Rhodospirillaceae bacterium]
MTNPQPVALAIGAGDAIGAAFAQRFVAGGYAVAVARRDASKSEGLIEQITASSGTLKAYASDARDEDACIELFDAVENDLGPIDVVLYNAGANARAPILETEAKLFRKVWELSCFGGFLAGREAARRMTPRGHGTILYTGATASLRGGPGFAAFASAKFGLRAVAQSLARELGPMGIHVAHLVIDGGVDSPAIHARRRAAAGDDDLEFPQDSLIDLATVAEAFWTLSQQKRDGWTHELDIRPFVEKW